VDAVVMAAGEGRRMRPVTERWPKPVLPIDGRSVIATLLHELAAAGLRDVIVVTGHLADQVERLVGDGSGFGLDVRFARQAAADGSADAVRTGLRAGAMLPVLVAGADTLFRAGDIGRFASAAGNAGAIAVRRDPPPEPPHRFAVRVEDGFVTKVLDDDPGNPLAGAPLWLVGTRVASFLVDVPGPPYELKDAFQRAVDEGLRVSGVEIGPTRDLTRPEDLIRENFPYLTDLP
jgi:NDP-sugar pyrophosphorylase family protein